MEKFDEDCSYALRDFATIRNKDISDHPFTYNLTDVDNISWEFSKDMPFSVTPHLHWFHMESRPVHSLTHQVKAAQIPHGPAGLGSQKDAHVTQGPKIARQADACLPDFP